MRAHIIVAIGLLAGACQSGETEPGTATGSSPVSESAPAVAPPQRLADTLPPAPPAPSLQAGYPLCESGGQLRWFIKARTISELFNSHPTPWKMEIYPNGSPYSEYEAAKAFAQGWCTLTTNYTSSSLAVIEDCNHTLPMPNGGCRKIRVDSREWYTFGDAIEEP